MTVLVIKPSMFGLSSLNQMNVNAVISANAINMHADISVIKQQWLPLIYGTFAATYIIHLLALYGMSNTLYY